MSASPRLFLAGLASLTLLACAPQSSPLATEDGEQRPLAAMMTCLREEGFTMLAAHRAGFGPGYPENAVSSIQRNAALGILFAEVDVAQSADGVLYLMHDRTLDRTTTGTGAIGEVDWAYISTLRLVDPEGVELDEGVPTLEAAVLAARDAGIYLNLDLKNVSIPDLLGAIDSLGARDEVAVIAYTVAAAGEMHAIDPGLLISAPDEPEALQAAGVNLDHVYLWIGVGEPDAQADARFAQQGLETSAGLFPLEDGTPALYVTSAAAGVEILSIDDVLTGSAALGGADSLNPQIEACR